MTDRSVDARLRVYGATAWRLVGIMLAASMGYAALVALSGLVVPLFFAIVMGALAVTVVDRLESYGLPRPGGALLLVTLLVGLIIGVLVLVVQTTVDEAIEIRAAVADGLSDVDDWLPGDGVVDDENGAVGRAGEQGRPLLTGGASWATTIFSSAVAFGVGSFLALFMLYYILVDWGRARDWLAGHFGVERELGVAIIDDAIDVVRRGVGVLTLTSLVTATVIGVAMVLLGLPLALSVVVVTFLASYVPYLGAILSSSFAFLVALGSGGIDDALILLVVVVLAQNIVQTLVSNRLASDRLRLHPLPSIISSVCGVAIAGFLGAMLSAPALALTLAISRRLATPEMVPGVDGTAA